MAATAWVYYSSFKDQLLDKVMDLENDTLKIALFLESSNAETLSTATFGALTNEHADGNGYATGGVIVAGTTTANNFDVEDANWTAVGGDIVARFAVMHNITTGGLIGYSLLNDTPADVTATDGNSLKVAINVNGVMDVV